MAPKPSTRRWGVSVSALKLIAFRITATVLAVFAAVLAVVGDHTFLRAAASGDGWSPEQAAWINGLFEGLWTAEALLAAAIALALVWRASHRPEARALTWFLVLLGLLNFDEPVRALGLVPAAAAAGMTLDVLGGATWWLALAAFLRFSVLFPRPLAPADLELAGLAPWRTRLLDAGVVWSGAVLLSLFSFALAGFAGGDVGAAAPVAFRLAGFILLLGLMVGFLWGVLQGVRHLRIRYRTVKGGDRRRILWVVQGFFLAMWAIFIGLAALLPAAVAVIGGRGWIWPVLPVLAIAVAPLVIVLFLAVAIFYDGAIDPGLVIRRTALYGAFGVVLTFLFEGVESLTSSVIAGRLGIPEGWAGWIAAGTVALVFGFARNRLNGPLERIVAPLTPTVVEADGPAPALGEEAGAPSQISRAD